MTTDNAPETTADLQITWPQPTWVARGQGSDMNPARVKQLAAAMRQEMVVGEWIQLVIELFGDDEDEMPGGIFTQAAWEKLGLLYKFGGSDPKSAGWNAALDAAREMLASSYKAGPPVEGADGRPGDDRAMVDAISDIPVAPAEDAGTGLRCAVRQILPYLDFTVGPESPGHHPSLPSAIDRLRAELEAEEGRH